jgi:hypothetical protein
MGAVLGLLGEGSPTIKVLAARGVDAVRDAIESVFRASVPLIVNDSPYAGRVVALIDEPKKETETLARLWRDLGDRLHELDAPTIEEYIPEALSERAGRSKAADRETLRTLSGDRLASNALKKEISTDIADVLKVDDFESIPIIVGAARQAIELAT